jgi:hypothetical protein
MLFHCSSVLALECAHLGVVDPTFGLQVDSLTTLLKRKLCALALCILLALREPQILDRLEQIIRFVPVILNLHVFAEVGNVACCQGLSWF